MRVVVKYAGSAAPSLAAWQTWLLAQPPHDPDVYQVMIDTMTDEFQQTNGLPPGSWWCTTLHPNRYVWRFASNAWIHFGIKDRKGVREVVVIAVADSPPP